MRGLATVNDWAEEVIAARAWYAALLGIEPYFQRPDADTPAYIEYRLGDYQRELGIIDVRYAPPAPAGWRTGTLTTWRPRYKGTARDDAREHQPITSWGPTGFVTASVVDPFVNILSVVDNPHYPEILGTQGTA